MKKKINEKNSLLTLLPSKDYKSSVFITNLKMSLKYLLILSLIFIVYVPTLFFIDHIHQITNYKVFEYDNGIIRISYALLVLILIIIVFNTLYLSKKCLKCFLKLKKDLYHVYILTPNSLIIYGSDLSVQHEYSWSSVKSIIFEHDKISFTVYDYENISKLNNTKEINIEYKLYTNCDLFYTKIDNLLNHELYKIKSKVIYN